MSPLELKSQREAAGLKRSVMADAIGVSERTIYRYETGERRIAQATAMAIRQVLQGARNRAPKSSKKLKQAS